MSLFSVVHKEDRQNEESHLHSCMQELSRVKASLVTERAQAEEELGKVRAQVRLEEQQHLTSLEEKLRAVRQSRDESQNHCTHQKQTIAELHAKVGQQSIEMDTLRRRIDELQQVQDPNAVTRGVLPVLFHYHGDT
ncbi:leucine-rich repeat-containing protein 45-like, partial [Sinocyclocheilus grahami]|uniref:leucine-rich repeat-containing protein 45-like n=1 Tax=Sinocyclocheilus grahami TaxID=75366 RepID=UPI0007AC9B8E